MDNENDARKAMSDRLPALPGIKNPSKTRDLSWSVKVFEEILFTAWG